MTSLPWFRKPPVVEVAISVQFNEMTGFELVHFGQLWDRLRDRYPRVEHHPRLGMAYELFGASGAQRASLAFGSGFPIGRCWYVNDDQTKVIQIQPDRFTINWRKNNDAEYPRYGVLRELFSSELGVLLEFAREHGLGDFIPGQCEVTYSNHIVVEPAKERGRRLETVLALWSGDGTEQYLPDIEDVRLRWQYKFDRDGNPVGRLHVEVQSARRSSDGVPILVVQMVGRGAPAGQTVDDVLKFNDHAHEWIVRGFTDLTTSHMHSLWERQA